MPSPCPPLGLPLASPWPCRREPQCHCRDKVNHMVACRWCIRARAPGAGWLCCVLRHGQYPPREATGGRDAPRGYDLLFVAAAGGCTLTLVLKLVLGRQTATARVRRGGIFPRCVSTRATDLTQHGPSRHAKSEVKAPPHLAASSRARVRRTRKTAACSAHFAWSASRVSVDKVLVLVLY